MTSLGCVFVAGLFHVMHYMALSSKGSNLSELKLPTVIVSLAAMDIIWDNCFIPRQLNIMPVVLKRIYELAVTFILLEIAVHVVWKEIEHICIPLTRILLIGTGLMSEFNYVKYESYCVGSVTIPLSLLILAFAGHATDHFHILHDCIFANQTKITLRVDESLKYLTKNPRLTKKKLPNIVNILQKHKDLARKQRRGRTFLSQFNRIVEPSDQ
ncbi:uncharacterized protein LOC108106974 [Drosophila eugracilis]|uniref:uncharacterized protein LOC108106974 n=1 Tax=Drosophila eugracilis TaxID=29029 RepID=UPI001BDA7092|nr:uncharacterized protein LOC108106974 [Drosophila eugracilis]